jgi:hypothetical protein
MFNNMVNQMKMNIWQCRKQISTHRFSVVCYYRFLNTDPAVLANHVLANHVLANHVLANHVFGSISEMDGTHT